MASRGSNQPVHTNAPQAPVPTLDGLHETIKRLRLENDPSGQVNSIRVEPTYLPFPELDKNGLETGKEVHAVVVDGVMCVSQRTWDAIEKARME